MTRTRGTGLLMEWVDIAPALEPEFNDWYDKEEIPRFSAVPGILGIGRYQAVEGGPRYLAMFELKDHGVLHSPEYLRCIRKRSASPQPAASIANAGRNYLRLGYRQIFPAMVDPAAQTAGMPPFLQVGRMDIPSAREEEFNAWYNTAYMPPYLDIEGCLAGRRFVAIEGEPKYLTMYELLASEVRHSAPWKAAKSSNPWTVRFQPLNHGAGSPGVYRRIYPA